MKKLIAIFTGIITIIGIAASAHAAYTIPWYATSTTQGWIYPVVNGVYQTPYVPNIIATSTTATSTFFGDVKVDASRQLVADKIRSIDSSGLDIYAYGGSPVALFGGGSGQNATFFDGLTSYGGMTAPFFTATTTTASTFPYASTTALSATSICFGTSCQTAWPTGTVTSIATNNGLTGGTITTTGTLGLDLTSISNNALLTYNGSRLAATGTPQLTVGNIVATSTTATSTFAGQVKVTGASILNADSILATSSSMTVYFSTSTSQTLRIGTGAMTVTLASSTPGSVLRLEVCNPTSGTAGTITWAAVSPEWIRWTGGTAPTQTTTANACDLWTFSTSNGTSTPFIHGAQIPW